MKPWTGSYEMDLIELGRRVANCYDEVHSIAYRIGGAIGFQRHEVPMDWQHVMARSGRVSRYVRSNGVDRTLHS